MEEALAAYHTWRDNLTRDDQMRWSYLLQDAEPLLVDVVKAAIKESVPNGLEDMVLDGLAGGVASAMFKALAA